MAISNILKKLNRRDSRLFPKFTKKSKLITFLSILALATIVTTSIFAASGTDAFTKKQDALTTGNNQESWMNEAAASNGMVGLNAMVGPIPPEVLAGKTNTGWIPGGIIGTANNSIAYLYNRPFSGLEYIASIKDNFLGKSAYATSGYDGISAILPIWRGFRNATYTIFSIVFIMIGIMIMLRVKISQQAVITIQSAIPKLITSLILVTFSFAIVGLLIDLSYLVEGVGLSIIYNATGGSPFTFNDITKPTLTQMLTSDQTMGLTQNLIPFAVILTLTSIISLIVGIIAAIPTTVVGGVTIGLVAFVVILAVVFLVIGFYVLKFFFGLVKCYVSIILKTIVAPFEIAMGAIPNMKMGFSSWFVDIIANILVFPISMIFLILVNALIKVTANQNMWAPHGIDTLNNLTGVSGGILPVAFGFGGLMLLSKLPKMIPEFIFQIKPSPWGKAIGETYAPIGAFVGKGAKGTGRYGADKGGDWIGDNYGNKDINGNFVKGTDTGEKVGNAINQITKRFAGKNR